MNSLSVCDSFLRFIQTPRIVNRYLYWYNSLYQIMIRYLCLQDRLVDKGKIFSKSRKHITDCRDLIAQFYLTNWILNVTSRLLFKVIHEAKNFVTFLLWLMFILVVKNTYPSSFTWVVKWYCPYLIRLTHYMLYTDTKIQLPDQ